MRVAVGADHAGYALKEALKKKIGELGHEIVDLGTHSTASVDYPDFGAAVGRAVVEGSAERGVCVCGSGIGISIAANKIHGVRAALVSEPVSARLCREHNDANVLCLGERLIGVALAEAAVEAFLSTAFLGGRHAARVGKLSALDK